MNVTIGRRKVPHRTVRFDRERNAILLIEQRLLPHQFKVVSIPDYIGTARAIKDMIVRGAGAIGATAAYGLAQGAHQFAEEDVDHCRAIGENGVKLIQPGMKVLTHCNAGWLAFVDIGSATAPMYEAQARGIDFHVFCSETRPRSQGATLTAWELANQGVSHQIVADNAAGHLMQRGEVDLVIVGSDRTLGRSGEVANKIGTYTRAVLAHRHRIPFYVAIPLSTLDWTLTDGMQIPIEERDENEVTGAWGVTRRGRREQVRVANPTSGAVNPGFDVTPAELITGIITPAGIFKPRDLWRQRAKLGWAEP